MICNIARSLLKKSEDVIEFSIVGNGQTFYTDERLVGKKNFILQDSRSPYAGYYSVTFAMVIDGVYKGLIFKDGESSPNLNFNKFDATSGYQAEVSIDSDTGRIVVGRDKMLQDVTYIIYAW